MVSNTEGMSLKEPLHSSQVINSQLLGSCHTAEQCAENSKQLSVRKLHALGPTKLQVFRNMVFKMSERRDFSVPGVVFVLLWFTGRFCSCFCLLACLLTMFYFLLWGGTAGMRVDMGRLGGEKNWGT